ncbi:unnamed protein product [Urochloa humidicola]
MPPPPCSRSPEAAARARELGARTQRRPPPARPAAANCSRACCPRLRRDGPVGAELLARGYPSARPCPAATCPFAEASKLASPCP